MEYERGDSGYRLYMVVGMLKLGEDAVVVTVMVERTSAQISGVICSWVAG